MEPHLYLNRGKKRVLLVRYFDKLHFVNLNRLPYKVRPWFLEKPRTEAEMDEKGLIRESIPLKNIRGVAAGGTGRGMVVQFYLKEGKRRYELSKDCDLSDMGALFDGLESFDPPKKDSNWHDPRLARQNPRRRNILWAVGWLLNLTAVVTGSSSGPWAMKFPGSAGSPCYAFRHPCCCTASSRITTTFSARNGNTDRKRAFAA